MTPFLRGQDSLGDSNSSTETNRWLRRKKRQITILFLNLWETNIARKHPHFTCSIGKSYAKGPFSSQLY